MTSSGRPSIFTSIIVPSRMVFFMWLIFYIQFQFGFGLLFLGIMPRTFVGLTGIFTSTFIHLTSYHLISNTLPLLVLGTMVYHFYSKIGNQVFLRCYVFTNILVWVFGRSAYHIGASGLIYALATFLILSGFFRRDFMSVAIAVFVIFVYGSIFFNMIPWSTAVSWEAHLLGVVTGGVTAYQLRK